MKLLPFVLSLCLASGTLAQRPTTTNEPLMIAPNGDVKPLLKNGNPPNLPLNSKVGGSPIGAGISGVAVSKTLYVDTAGNNSTGLRGRLDKPFLTIAAAVAAGSAGDVIEVGPGTFAGTASIVLPANVSLNGSGAEVTIITSTVDLGTGPIIIPGNNSRISNLTIQGTAAAGVFQAPLGSNTGNQVFTNAVVSDVRMIGDTDGIYLQPSGACSLKVFDSTVETNWDAVVVLASSTVEMYGCEVTSTGPALSGLPQAGKGLQTSGGSGSIIRFYNGKITVNGSVNSNSGAFASGSGIVEVHNTTFDVSGNVPFDLKQNTSGVLYVDNVSRVNGAAMAVSGTATQLSRFASRDNNGSDFPSPSTVRTNIGAAASGANTDITSFAVTAASTMSLASAAPNGTIALWTMTNPALASSGNQQFSPAQLQVGQGWKTDATAASRMVSFRNYVTTVQGTSNPSGYWTLEGRIHTGAYSNPLKYFSDGNLQPFTGYLSSDGTAGATATTGGATFKNGLYTGGTISGGGGGLANVVEDTTPQLGGDLDLNGHVITGYVIGTDVLPVTNPIPLFPNAAMGALAVDVTRRNNTKSVSVDSTLTFSGTPGTGATFGLTLTNTDTAAHTITIPSSYSLTTSGARTTFPIAASEKLELSWRYDGTTYFLAGDPGKQADVWMVAVSDETTDLTTGTAKATFRAPRAATVTGVRASVNTVSSSGLPTFDINEAGTTILSTKLTIDASEKTSVTAATPAVISDSAIADDAEMTIDIDTAGTGAKGAKVVIYVQY